MREATAGNGAAATSVDKRSEPVKLLKRIGSTTFVVSVHFSKTSTETMQEKILRLIEREVTKNA